MIYNRGNQRHIIQPTTQFCPFKIKLENHLVCLRNAFTLTLLTFSIAPIAALSQGNLPNDPLIPAGHSMHGEAFNEGPRQKAELMEGMGSVKFPITTKKPLAQRFFNQGVAQLHGFPCRVVQHLT